MEPGKATTDPALEDAVFDRLDAIEAERVMQRALELEAEALGGHTTISAEQLQRVAREIGVDAQFVQQALGEVRLAPQARSRLARWIVPQDLFETADVSGITRAELDAAIVKWMTQNEGLTRGAQLDDGTEWDVDRRWRVRALAASLNGGNRISRVAGGDIAHRVHSLGEHQHKVALSSQGRRPQLFAQLVFGVGTVLGGVLLLGSAIQDELAYGVPTSLGCIALALWIGIGGARWWARGIRGALRRSLAGLVAASARTRRRWLPRRPFR